MQNKKYLVVWEEFADIENGSGMIYNCAECDNLAEMAFSYRDAIMDKRKYDVKVCEILETEEDIK